ncbi:MAG: hypothetical protein AAB443_04790 [Patescibacteria group bacterium]
MDLQVFLLVILSLLTINAIVVGVFVVLLLKEFSITLKKINLIVEDVRLLAGTVSKPVSTIAEFADGLTSGLKVFGFLRSMGRGRKERD